MATIQLIDVRPGVAVVQKDDNPPVEMTWGLLHEAQYQVGVAGYVYRWLMEEYCRCEYEQRKGRPWQSPRREVEDIVQNLSVRDAREEADDRETLRKAKERQDAEEQQRRRDEERRRVDEERQRTEPDNPWWPIPSWEVPEGVRFDTPRRHQGQIVEVSFGTFDRSEAGECDPWMAVTDHSDGSCRLYRRRSV